MHVLHYVPNFYNPLGGREFFVRDLIQHLIKFGIDQSIVTNGIFRNVDPRPDFNVISLKETTFGGYKILHNLFSVVQDTRYSIIHIHGYGEYPADVVCLLKKIRRIKVPIILTTHGIAGLQHGYLALQPSFRLAPGERILRLLHLPYDFTLGRLEMNTFDRVAVSSEEEKEYLCKIGLNLKRILNMPSGINDVFFVPGSSNSISNRKYILYVGRIDRFKGIDTLVRAINELKLENISVKCLIVGRDVGYKSKLQSLIDHLMLSDMIEIREAVSQKNLVELYSSAIVTVLASSSEGFPLTVLESFASGTPFIGTPVGAIAELIRRAKAGLLVPIDDSIAIARSIKSLLNDRELWSEMSRRGRDFAQNFRSSVIAKKYYETYLEISKLRK